VAVKRMASISHDGNRTIVEINSSSLAQIMDCHRQAHYSLNLKINRGAEAPALTAGSATHKVMEVWYSSPQQARNYITPECMDSQHAFKSGRTNNSVTHGRCARCSAIYAGIQAGFALRHLEETEARSLPNLVDIWNSYFDYWLLKGDPWEILTDKDGPMIERQLEAVYFEDDDLTIKLFGTIDAVLMNITTGQTVICDHKTTKSIGKDFMNRHRPNFQYTIYTWLAREVLGIDTPYFMINAIQVAKLKRDFKRIDSTRNETDFKELKLSLLHHTRSWIASNEAKLYPQSTPNACSMWGGCRFREICESDEDIRGAIIAANYERGDHA